MDRIRFLALVRAVKQQAARWGYHGDVLADANCVPLVGTLHQQLIMATIAADVRPRPTTEADRRALWQLVRAVVLTSPAPLNEHDVDRPALPDAIARASRHAVFHRRQQRRRTRR